MPKQNQKSSWESESITKKSFLESLGLEKVRHQCDDNENLEAKHHQEQEINDVELEEEFHEENENAPEKYHLNENSSFEMKQNSNENECIEKLSCSKFPKKFNNKRTLKSHVYESHSGTRSCSLCLLTFKGPGILRRHMLQVHRRLHDETVCIVCGKSFSRTDYLRKHEIKCRQEKVKLNCQYCTKEFSSKRGKTLQEKLDGRRDIIKIGKSTRYLSNDEVEIQASKRVVCHMCDEIFTCQQNLQKHKEIEHGLNQG